MRLFFILGLVSVFLTGCTAMTVDTATTQQARSSASALGSKTAPEFSAMSAEAVTEDDNWGNFGILWRFKSVLSSTRDADGLTRDVATETGIKGPAHVTEYKSSTLCGLSTLEQAVRRVSTSETMAFFPMAGALVPVNVDAIASPSALKVATTFESRTPEVCSPVLGKELHYKVAGQAETVTPGLVGTMRLNAPYMDEATCTTEPVPENLSYLKSVGATLIAKCTHVAQGKAQRPTASEHVYLPQSGRFLPLRFEYSPRSTRTYEYTSIRFSK